MAKYKVGDKVRIRSRAWIDAQEKDDNGCIINNGACIKTMIWGMQIYAGKEAEIKHASSAEAYKTSVDGENYWWADWMFEDPAEPYRDYREEEIESKGESNMSNENKNGEHPSKYKMFRNFMYNDLGITKEDVKEWVREAIADEVERLVGQIGIDNMVARGVREIISDKMRLYNQQILAEIVYRLANDAGFYVRIEQKERKVQDD
jgi:hypothetical protein